MEREGLLALVDRQEKGYNGERRLASLGRQAGERVQHTDTRKAWDQNLLEQDLFL